MMKLLQILIVKREQCITNVNGYRRSICSCKVIPCLICTDIICHCNYHSFNHACHRENNIELVMYSRLNNTQGSWIYISWTFDYYLQNRKLFQQNDRFCNELFQNSNTFTHFEGKSFRSNSFTSQSDEFTHLKTPCPTQASLNLMSIPIISALV